MCAAGGANTAGAAWSAPRLRVDLIDQDQSAPSAQFIDDLHRANDALVLCPADNDADDFCQWMLSDYSYENATVMMAPASGFYATEGKGKNEVRMAYVLNREDLKKAIKCLEEGLKVYNTKK